MFVFIRKVYEKRVKSYSQNKRPFLSMIVAYYLWNTLGYMT